MGLDRASGLAVVAQTLAVFTYSADSALAAKHVPPLAFAGRDAQATGHDAVVDVARYFWRQVLDPQSVCPITHDMYLKRWQLENPRLPYDGIMLDDAQDADPVILDVIRRQSAQLVLVGVPHQAIYGWRGAHNALARWRGTTLPLTTSWRFGPAIADAANDVLKRLHAPHRLVGAGPAGSPQGPHAFLSRTTMGLLGQTLSELDRRRVSVLGGAEPLAARLDGAHLRTGQRVLHPDLALFPTWPDLEAAAKTSAGAEFRPLVQFVSRRHDVPRIANRLRTDTVPPERAAVVLATAHKAQGQEWTTVSCSPDLRWPRYIEDREEAHLIYVALTRAQHALDADALRHVVMRSRPMPDLPHRPPERSVAPTPSRAHGVHR